ncbi:hypothetical protein EMPS_03770 [Entomortierella parvispora]|uniref:Beta-lactamase-related domain-containing protein n=1 Tax=Entomortierella parvispora TaxID=205924 RepID=A0A9P3H7G4_9FUNG|nr:hypothetical protein EMPS_03770 [Entomortierella parvispora]
MQPTSSAASPVPATAASKVDQPQLFKDLSTAIEASRKACGMVGGAVAILFKGELVFAEGFGIRNEQQEPYTPETLSPIASLTKAFTATAIGELVAEGKMDWDKTPVNKYLPVFELQDPTLTRKLTISDLLSHQTGLPSTAFLFYRNQRSRLETIQAFRELTIPEDRPHVPKYQYDNSMYTVAGEAAVAASGLENATLEDLIDQKVIKPLGLENTGFTTTEMKKRAPHNHARGFLASSFDDAKEGRYEQLELDELFASSAAAGDLFSNVLDLVKWGKAVIDHGAAASEKSGDSEEGEPSKKKKKMVLNTKSVRETLTPKVIAPVGSSRTPDFPLMAAYGYGWAINSYKGQANYSHSGGLAGFTAHLCMFPDSDLVIAQVNNMLENALCYGVVYHIADVLLDLPRTRDWLGEAVVNNTESYYKYSKMAEWGFPEQVPNTTPCHSDLEAYVGEFVNPMAQEIVVRLEKGDDLSSPDKLYAKLWQTEHELVHYHFNSFVVDLKDMSFRGKALATFQTGPKGKVDALVLDYAEGEGSMLFKRKEQLRPSTWQSVHSNK